MQVVRFGKILFNLQFLALAVRAASVLSFILPAIYYIVLIFIAFFTLFAAFANPTFRSFWSSGEHLAKITEALSYSWKFTVPIVLALAIGSILCLCFDKNQKHVARIVTSVVLALLSIIVLVLKLINGGGSL